MFFKEYLFSLRKFILIATLLFFFAVFNGYFSAQNYPSEARLILEKMEETFKPITEMPAFNQFLFVVLNNGLTSFLAIVLGIVLGIFPFLVLFSNGIILGTVVYFFKSELSLPTFFVGTLPHGIIEIPVIILSCAVGFNLGKTALERIFKKILPHQKFGEEHLSLKTELNTALVFFLKFLFPLLVLAAAIEVFITARLLS